MYLQALTESIQSRWLQPGLRWRLAVWAIHRRLLEPMRFLPLSRSKRIRFSLRRPSHSVTVPRRKRKSPVLLPHLRQRISMPVSRQALSAFFRVRLPALTSAALQATLPARGITSDTRFLDSWKRNRLDTSLCCGRYSDRQYRQYPS